MIKALQQGIRRGSLHLTDRHGEEYIFGNQPSKQTATGLRVINDNFWLRVFCGHDLGCLYPSHIVKITSINMAQLQKHICTGTLKPRA